MNICYRPYWGSLNFCKLNMLLFEVNGMLFFREIQENYASVEAIEKFAELNIRQAEVLDELNKVKLRLREATAREV